VQTLGQLVEHVQPAVIPAALVARGRKDLVECRPESEGTIADRQQRGFGQAARLE
jgi:hypothetical protein